MPHLPKDYAEAFVAVIETEKSDADNKKAITRLWASIQKHRDTKKASRIIDAIESLLVAKAGGTRWEVETARPLKQAVSLEGISGAKDIVHERINPDLLAGVRITKNNEEQFDGSLQAKLNKLFAEQVT